jgi:hypothetical protein
MADTNPNLHNSEKNTGGYERRDTNWRLVLKLLAGLTLATAAIVYLLWVLFASLEQRSGNKPVLSAQRTPEVPIIPPEPRLQLSPRKDMEEMRAQEDAILNSYGWVDRARGQVRIPIARAMELTLAEGLPVRPQQATSARDRMTSFAADSASGRFIERRPY